jgi:hypothetical protein
MLVMLYSMPLLGILYVSSSMPLFNQELKLPSSLYMLSLSPTVRNLTTTKVSSSGVSSSKVQRKQNYLIVPLSSASRKHCHLRSIAEYIRTLEDRTLTLHSYTLGGRCPFEILLIERCCFWDSVICKTSGYSSDQ